MSPRLTGCSIIIKAAYSLCLSAGDSAKNVQNALWIDSLIEWPLIGIEIRMVFCCCFVPLFIVVITIRNNNKDGLDLIEKFKCNDESRKQAEWVTPEQYCRWSNRWRRLLRLNLWSWLHACAIVHNQTLTEQHAAAGSLSTWRENERERATHCGQPR